MANGDEGQIMGEGRGRTDLGHGVGSRRDDTIDVKEGRKIDG